MIILKNILRFLANLTGIGLIALLGLLGLSGVSGKFQDKREENLVISNDIYKKVNHFLVLENKVLKSEIKKLQNIKDTIINIPYNNNNDTIIMEKKIPFMINLTTEESLGIGRIEYPFIYNQKRDSFIEQSRKNNSIIILKGKDTILKK